MLKKIYWFALGAWEFRTSVTTSPPDNDDGTLLDYYDWGREYTHRITFRQWDGG